MILELNDVLKALEDLSEEVNLAAKSQRNYSMITFQESPVMRRIRAATKTMKRLLKE